MESSLKKELTEAFSAGMDKALNKNLNKNHLTAAGTWIAAGIFLFAVLTYQNHGYHKLLDAKTEPLKEDMERVKKDMAGVKEDMAGVKADMAGIKEDITEIKTSLNRLENKFDLWMKQQSKP